MNKLYLPTPHTNLTYKEAQTFLDKGICVTRPEWDGFHFKYGLDYCILTKDKQLLYNPLEIYDTDKCDWCAVVESPEALKIIKGALENVK